MKYLRSIIAIMLLFVAPLLIQSQSSEALGELNLNLRKWGYKPYIDDTSIPQLELSVKNGNLEIIRRNNHEQMRTLSGFDGPEYYKNIIDLTKITKIEIVENPQPCISLNIFTEPLAIKIYVKYPNNSEEVRWKHEDKWFEEWGWKNSSITIKKTEYSNEHIIRANAIIDTLVNIALRNGNQYMKPVKPESTIKSGTGFAISTDGIIVTNYHVISDAKTINVRGVNSDFSKTYKAKILVTDKNNDLAIIQIENPVSIKAIPFTIKYTIAGVGENIYVLGYPLRATMGDEVKLTNGIISSKTGYQSDVSCYQISAPVQPGNSGGPLFDMQGNLIGIVSAKHTQAENASYAIKSNYLKSLIELLTNPPKLQKINLLTGKSLTQQVELVKKYVYIIEVE